MKRNMLLLLITNVHQGVLKRLGLSDVSGEFLASSRAHAMSLISSDKLKIKEPDEKDQFSSDICSGNRVMDNQGRNREEILHKAYPTTAG